MRNIKLFLLLFAIILTTSTLAKYSNSIAASLLNIMISKDSYAFEKHFIDKDLKPTEDDYLYYFGGNDNNSALVTFLSHIDIQHKTFENNNLLTIVYYRNSLMPVPEMIDWQKFKTGWLESVVVVEMKQVQGKYVFDKTPFFLFRHAPWAQDYG
jgi:hypothetical protein